MGSSVAQPTTERDKDKEKEVALMRRILMALMIATVALLVVIISPAMAQEEQQQAEDSIVYFPYGNVGTYSCTGGSPFVSDSAGTGNCSIEQIGAPSGL